MTWLRVVEFARAALTLLKNAKDQGLIRIGGTAGWVLDKGREYGLWQRGKGPELRGRR